MSNSEITFVLPAGEKGSALRAIIASSTELQRLFKAMEDDEHLAKFLLLNKFDLFHVDEDNKVPMFHTVRNRGSGIETHILSEIATATQTTDIAALPEQMFGPLGENKALEQLVSGAAYGVIMGLAASPVLREFVGQESVSFGEWQTLVRRAGGIGKLLEKMATDAKSASSVEDELQNVMNNASREIANSVSSRLDEMAALMKNPFPDMLLQMHTMGSEWVANIQRLTGMSLEELERVLSRLIKLRLVETQSCIAWCHKCQVDRDAFQLLQGTVGLQRYATHNCFACEGPVSYAAIMYPVGALRAVLLAKDGLLGAFVDWKLGNRATDRFFEAGGRENDAYTDRHNLVEVKMYQTSKDDGTIRRSVGTDINKLKKFVPGLKADLPDLQGVYFVTNLHGHVLERLSQKEEMSNGLKINLVGIDNLKDF
jgi:hypothetical protein